MKHNDVDVLPIIIFLFSVLIMSRETAPEFTMPCLGRPFQLGMLYDCRSDQIVPSVALWSEETLKRAIDGKHKPYSNFEVIADNSTESKLSKLGIDENLRLSFLAGLVDVSGAASYLNDQTSSENQVRISMRYHSTAWIEELSMEKLGDFDNPDVLEDTAATHFVSGVLYGNDAIFVFDQEVSDDEKIPSKEFMETMVESLCTSGSAACIISDSDERKVQKFHCKFYCDLKLPESPSTFEGAVKLCKDLPQRLNERDSAIKVWLCPLNKLNSKVAPVVQEISAVIVTQTQEFMEAMHEFEMKTSDLRNSEVCAGFRVIKEQLSCFKKNISEYKVDFATKLATWIPRIRGKIDEIDELNELFRRKNGSPFSHESLSSWVQGKTDEVNVLQTYLSRMEDFKFISFPGDMHAVINDPEYDLVISFTFKAPGQRDPYLERMTAYLQTQATGQEIMNPTPWYSNSEVVKNMKLQTRLFKSFAKANEQAKETKFVVTSSSSDELSEEGAVIELYENCKKEVFEPPSQPGKPTATSVTHSSIQVKWSKPEYGSQNVKFYKVFYRDHRCSPEQWIAEQSAINSITVENLGPQKKYCFKVQAVCKAGISEVSEASEPIQTDLVSVAPGKPIVSSKSHNSIQLQWSKAQYGEQDVDFYTISCHETKDSPELESKKVKTEGAKQSATVGDLDPQTEYCFKVHAEFKTGLSLVMTSDTSDPVQTYPVPVPPGKPTASNVTHNSIQLEWSKAQCEGHNIEFYTVFYHDQPAVELENWKQTKTTNHHPSINISNLMAQTAYSFKVRAEFSGDIKLASDVSEPIETDPDPIPPGKPAASSVTYKSVHLEWSKPQYKEEQVNCYTIFYHETTNPPVHEQKWEEVKMDAIDRESVTVSSLAPNTQYSFKVHAKFESGLDLPSDSSDPVQTYPVPVPPGKPTASNVTHNSIQLEWSKAQCEGHNIEFYTVFYHDQPAVELENWKQTKTTNHHPSINISNLMAQTAYSFKVRAEFSGDIKLASDVSEPIETDPDPIPPGKPATSSVTYKSVHLEWSKPQYKEEQVNCYTIFYHETTNPPVQEQKWEEVKMDAIDRESVTVSSLAPNTQYSFKVHAKFKSGLDLPSDSSDPVQTYPVPVPPGKPTASIVTHDSVQLEWSEPQYGGQSVELYTVLYRGDNDPPKQWKEVTINSSKQSVTVDNLASHTEYSFKVLAKFKAGDVCSDVSEPIETDPDPIPPGKPAASSVTYKSVHLEWSKPQYKEEHVNCYTIFYHETTNPPVQEQKWEEVKMDAIDRESVTVSSLAPNTQYSFKVHAKFESGLDLPSDSSDPVQTYPVPVPPGKPTASIVTHDSVQLEWSEPQYGGQSVELYTVLYRGDNDPPKQWKEVTVNSSKQSVTVDNLASHTEYSFKVLAKFKAGDVCSDVSEPIETDPDPIPPGKPAASSVTYKSVHLEWSKPQYKEEQVNCYTIFYHETTNPPVQEQKWEEVKMDAIDRESVTVSSLAPNTQYSFKVHAKFEGGLDLPSDSSDLVQTYPVPVPPGKPTASNVTHDSVQLEWSEPQYGEQSVELYTVLYREVNDPPKQWKEVTVNSSKQSVTVDNLASHTEYSFKVLAKFKAGDVCSDVSELIETDPDPIPPGKPAASSVTYKSVHLEWSKPQYKEEQVNCYTIFYHETTNPPVQEQKWEEVKMDAIDRESVTVSSLAPNTQYSFKVHAKFEGGLDLPSDSSDLVQTYPVPVPPGKPTASNVTHDSVQLEWSEPQYGEQSVELYTVLYREVNDPPKQWKEVTVNSSKQSVTVDNLASHTEYSFKVLAKFKAGDVCSDVSELIETDPDPIPPGKPAASSVTYKSVHLEWSKPQYKEEQVNCYTIFYHETTNPPVQEQKWEEVKMDAIDRESVTVSSLAPNTQYSFKVHAKFESGLDLPSDSSDPVQTYLVPVPPGKPTASIVTHDSVQLEWSEPQYGGQSVELYTVLYRGDNDPPKQWKEVTVNSSKQSVTVDNLASHTEYSFKVLAKFKAGDVCSDVSEPIETDPDPIPPGKPAASSVTYKSVHLEWSKPQYKEEHVNCYTIFYHETTNPPVQEQKWEEVKMDAIDRESVTVSSLAPNTQYSFKVHAKFEGGLDLPSDSSDLVQTYPVPVPPGKPTASNVTHDSVQLEWSEPQYGGQSVELYTVLYRGDNDPPKQWKEVTVNSSKQSVTVDNLASHTEYSFKVLAKFRADDVCSDVSEPIKTDPLPIPPGKPFASDVTHDSVQLKWSKAQCAGQNAEFYTVSYHETLDSKPKWKELKAKCSTECTALSGLAAQTQYSIQVHAKFKTGKSLYSEVSYPIQTYPAPVPPGKPTASDVTHNSVNLEWSEAQYYEGQSVEFYTVFYSDINDHLKQWEEVRLDSPKLSVTVDNLASQTVYSFKVLAKFKADYICSDVSDPIKTLSPPVPPGKPATSSISCNSVQLEWSKAQYGTQNVSYSVFYYEFGQAKEIDTPTSSVTVRNLRPQTEYQFRVTAKFRNGMKLFSDISDVIKTCPLPEPPGKPFTSSVSHDKVTLKWSVSQYGGENAEFYTVLISMLGRQPEEWREIPTRNSLRCDFLTVSKLLPDIKYCFKVRANFKNGNILESEPSNPIQVTPPVPPGKPIASKVTHNSVHLEWTEPLYGDQKVQCYIVFSSDLLTSEQREETKTQDTSVTVSELIAERKYSFQVHAEFKDGKTLDSDSSDPILTKPSPVHPGRPIAYNVTHNNVLLEWSKAQYGANNIDYYTVYYCKTGNTQNQGMWESIKVSNTSAVVSGLMAKTMYSFRVDAIFKGGFTLDGKFSDPVQTYPSPRKPGKPTANIVTHDTVQVQWTEAQYGNQKLQLYHIFYRKIEGSKEVGEWMQNTSTSTNVIIGNLNPLSFYRFRIRAEFANSTILSSETSDPIQTPSPPVPPGKPFASNRTHNSIQLEWGMPEYEAQMVDHYTVFYCKSKNKETWMEVKVGNRFRKEFVAVYDLAPATEYLFKVHAVFKFGTECSETSDSICTHPASVIPGKPYPYFVTHNSIELQWERPGYGAEYIKHYSVSYSETGGSPTQWKNKKTKGAIGSITIHGLGAQKEYCFKILAEIQTCHLTSGISETSDPIKTKTRIALQMFSQHPIKEGPLEIHKLSMVEQMSDKRNRIKKCFISKHPPCLPSVKKVLLVVGATGAGKSTLINGMINYIVNVEWQAPFRFKLITEEEQQAQAKSQTKWITAYTIPKMEGSPVPYTLTVIDTPGFGDTEGLERDKEITRQIKEFFSKSGDDGIDHIDGIGFVTQSALARLTPTQRYIFNSILSIFGKDVANNIFMMVTFADGQPPPVMAAVKDAGFPYCESYKFNNSALFASNDIETDDEDPEEDNFDKMFWRMGTVSFKKFFADFHKATPTSLQLTREVLDERERLETTVSGLQPQINRGLAKIEEMRQEEEVLQQHEADIAANKGFTYVVDVTKQRRVDLQGTGIHVTNCFRCNYTCHKECKIPKDEDKHKCSSMDRISGFCTVCTGKCKWDQHVNNPYRYEEYAEKEVRTTEDLKKKYDQAVIGKTKKERLMMGIDSQLKEVHTEVLTMIKQVQRCLHRLDEIALKPNPLTEVDFLELLIESEKQQAEPGWKHRVKYLESAKEQAVMLKNLQAKDVVAKMEAEQDPRGKPRSVSWYSRFKYWVGSS